MSEFAWKSPLRGLIVPGRHGGGDGPPGVVYGELRRSLYSITPARGCTDEVSRLLRGRLGLSLPNSGHFETDGGFSLIWSGLNQWMLAGPPGQPGPDFRDLRKLLDDNAALVDHGDARAIFRVSGTGARRTLARLCAVDLHPRRFGPGRCAATRMAHIGALLQQLDDAPTFEVHVFRGFAESFHDELREAATEFGYQGDISP
jgi:sarcosine oxidase subunit gamma